jgi:glutamate-1-semialdehyde 2,1-aminomutase
VYDRLEEKAARLEGGLGGAQRVGAMLTVFQTDGAVRNFDDAQTCDTERYGALFRHLLQNGIYVAPSQFEAMFVSLAHSDEDIDRTIEAFRSFAG